MALVGEPAGKGDLGKRNVWLLHQILRQVDTSLH
jgi:hypothetical protein